MNQDGNTVLEGEIDTTTEEGKLSLILHLIQLDTLEERLVYGVSILREQEDNRDESLIREEITTWLQDLDNSLTQFQGLAFPEPGLLVTES